MILRILQTIGRTQPIKKPLHRQIIEEIREYIYGPNRIRVQDPSYGVAEENMRIRPRDHYDRLKQCMQY
jgi:hypothetical protein